MGDLGVILSRGRGCRISRGEREWRSNSAGCLCLVFWGGSVVGLEAAAGLWVQVGLVPSEFAVIDFGVKGDRSADVRCRRL